MKNKLLFALIVALLATLITTTPAFAGFDGISFKVYDAVTLHEWGWSSGQRWRIYVSGSSSTTLMDSGWLQSPANGTLNYSCAYGGACAGTTLGTPVAGETVTVYILLDGTVDDPTTIIKTYIEPPAPITGLGNYIINENSGSGPNAVTLAGANTESPSMWLAVALGAVTLIGVSGVMLLLRRRRIA